MFLILQNVLILVKEVLLNIHLLLVEGNIENHMVIGKKFVHTSSPIFNKIGVSHFDITSNIFGRMTLLMPQLQKFSFQLLLNPQHPV
jgi:hypothetical protein